MKVYLINHLNSKALVEGLTSNVSGGWENKNMEISDLQAQLRAFTEERDWEQFHTVKNLILALTGEVGELAAVVQWLESVDLDSLNADPKLRSDFNQELADVFIYLLRLADITQTNLIQVAYEKMSENAKRYTIEKSKGNAEKQ